MNINDFTYTPNHTDKDMEAARKFLLEEHNDFHSTANYAWICGDASVHRNVGDVCHSRIGYPQWDDIKLVVTEAYVHAENRKHDNRYAAYNENGRWFKYERPTGLAIPFLTWLINESVFGRFILNRDDPETIDKGFIVSGQLPAAILQSIMILGRHFYEVRNESFEQFNKLIDMGIPGSVAYPVCFNTEYGANSNFGKKSDDAPVVAKYGHRVMALFEKLEYYQNFIKGEIHELVDMPYADRKTTNGTSTLFNPVNVGGKAVFTSGLIMNDPAFKAALRDFRGEATGPASIINPFTPQQPGRPSPTDVTYKEMFEFVIPFLHVRGDFKDAIH